MRLALGSPLTLNRHWRRKPPPVPFKVPRAILALPIWLIDWLRIDECTSCARPLVVRVDIIHINEETRIRDVRGHRGIEPMFRRHAVKPDRRVTRTDLAMDRLTFRVSIHAPGTEAEGIDEEIVSRCDVLINQNRNDSLENETWCGVCFNAWLASRGAVQHQLVEDVGTNLGRIGVPVVLPVTVDFPVRAREPEIVRGAPTHNRVVSHAKLIIRSEVHHRRHTTSRSGGPNDIRSVRKRVDHFDPDFKANGTVPIDRHVPTGPESPGADK